MSENFTPKKYYIKTYGCQANIADSSSLAGILDALGYEGISESVDYPNETQRLLEILPGIDLFVLNTCSVRQKSEDKVYGIGKVLKQIKKKPFIVLAGCMVGSVTGERQRYEFDVLKKKTPWVDLYINPSQVFELPVRLKEVGHLGEWAVNKLNLEEFNNLIPKDINSTQAYVNISYGCDNFCSFCVVPYARGKEISRPKEHILKEIEHLLARGTTEITLCGQNVNSWGLDQKTKFGIRTGSSQKLPFADLLREVHELSGVQKISFLSSNPFDFTEDLIDAIKLPKMSRYLHIAVQSGNNEILKKMNRRHTIEDFLLLVEKIKSLVPDVELGTDIIVGFPGETEDQFLDTLKLLEKVKFRVAFISMYSARKGTPADRLYIDDISIEEKKRRHALATNALKRNL